MEHAGDGLVDSHEIVDGWLDSLPRGARERALDIMDEAAPRFHALMERGGASKADSLLIALVEHELGILGT